MSPSTKSSAHGTTVPTSREILELFFRGESSNGFQSELSSRISRSTTSDATLDGLIFHLQSLGFTFYTELQDLVDPDSGLHCVRRQENLCPLENHDGVCTIEHEVEPNDYRVEHYDLPFCTLEEAEKCEEEEQERGSGIDDDDNHEDDYESESSDEDSEEEVDSETETETAVSHEALTDDSETDTAVSDDSESTDDSDDVLSSDEDSIPRERISNIYTDTTPAWPEAKRWARLSPFATPSLALRTSFKVSGPIITR